MSLITKFITAVTEPQFMLARDLMALAVADGEVTEEEQEAISNICHIEGIDEEHLINNLQRNTEHFPLYVPQTRKEKEEYLRDLILLISDFGQQDGTESDGYCGTLYGYGHSNILSWRHWL